MIDKNGWGPGPWQDEPDHLEWKSHGFPCLMRRSPTSGAWCGYVAVPKGHRYHGRDWSDIDVHVHGGPTYADECSGDICHKPAPGEPDDVWWIGFDTAHGMDFAPKSEMDYRRLGVPGMASIFHGRYRDMAYVQAEVESLAKQMLEADRQ